MPALILISKPMPNNRLLIGKKEKNAKKYLIPVFSLGFSLEFGGRQR
jgi:hypothetical protein